MEEKQLTRYYKQRTSGFKGLIEDARFLHGVRGGDVFLPEWPFQALYWAREVDSVLQLILISKVNFLKVSIKLEVSRNFLKVFRNFFSIMWLDQY